MESIYHQFPNTRYIFWFHVYWHCWMMKNLLNENKNYYSNNRSRYHYYIFMIILLYLYTFYLFHSITHFSLYYIITVNYLIDIETVQIFFILLSLPESILKITTVELLRQTECNFFRILWTKLISNSRCFHWTDQ